MNTLVITEINFSALPDVKASVNPGSARMVESLEDGVLKEIPVTLRKTPGFTAGSRETYAVIWRIVGATEPLTQRSYYLYFDVTANTNIGTPAYSPVLADDARLPGENLIANGDFSDGLKGWEVSGNVAVDPAVRHIDAPTVKIAGKALIEKTVPMEAGKNMFSAAG